MGYSQQRFSPLTQINRQMVKRLVPAWAYSMADNRGLEAQALVKDGVIYITDHEKTVALDATNRQANLEIGVRVSARHHAGRLLRHRQSRGRPV
jgi:glucose dehydrogenase